MVALLVASLLQFAAAGRPAAATPIDTSYGSQGGGAIDLAGGSGDVINAVAALPDGSIVTVGSTVVTSARKTDFLVMRIDAQGKPLPRLQGITGLLGGNSAVATSVAVDGDGGLAVAGYDETGTTLGTKGVQERDAVVARYNADGELVTTFGDGGVVKFRADQTSQAFGVGFEIRPGGGAASDVIVVGGACTGSDFFNETSLVARFTPRGVSDKRFGETKFGAGKGLGYATDVLTDPDLYGDCTNPDHFPHGAVVQSPTSGSSTVTSVFGGVNVTRAFGLGVRRHLLSDPTSSPGTLDPTFNDIQSPTGLEVKPVGVAQQTDGHLVVAGTIESAKGGIFLMGINPTLLDVNGHATITFTNAGGDGGASFRPTAVTVLADNKILVAGSASSTPGSPPDSLALARFLPDTGLLDTSFNHGGTVVGPKGSGGGVATAGCKAVVAGANGKNVRLARYFVGPPEVKSVAGAEGPATGGTTVSVGGECLFKEEGLRFGSDPATNVADNGTGQAMTAHTPPHGPGKVDVTSGDGSVLKDGFTYLPTVTGVSPATGTTEGGDDVIILGKGMGGAKAVTFDQTRATFVKAFDAGASDAPAGCNRESCVLVRTPPHAAGPVHVVTDIPKAALPEGLLDANAYEYKTPKPGDNKTTDGPGVVTPGGNGNGTGGGTPTGGAGTGGSNANYFSGGGLTSPGQSSALSLSPADSASAGYFAPGQSSLSPGSAANAAGSNLPPGGGARSPQGVAAGSAVGTPPPLALAPASPAPLPPPAGAGHRPAAAGGTGHTDTGPGSRRYKMVAADRATAGMTLAAGAVALCFAYALAGRRRPDDDGVRACPASAGSGRPSPRIRPA